MNKRERKEKKEGEKEQKRKEDRKDKQKIKEYCSLLPPPPYFPKYMCRYEPNIFLSFLTSKTKCLYKADYFVCNSGRKKFAPVQRDWNSITKDKGLLQLIKEPVV
jgi:hypothetical protein